MPPCQHDNATVSYPTMDQGDTHRRKRCKRVDIEGHAHYLTFSCFRRQPFLNGQHGPRWFIESVAAARERHAFDLWAFVIMPEHIHLLVLPHEGSRISAILKGIKLPVARRAIRWAREQRPALLERMRDPRPNGTGAYRFWQRGGGYDRNLWTPRDIHQKIQYIHANPVRRGLVENPEQWQWSSFEAWEKDVDMPIRIDRDSLPPLEYLGEHR